MSKLRNKKRPKSQDPTTILAKGVDSLYLYLEHGLDFKWLYDVAKVTPFYDSINIRNVEFYRSKAYSRSYPVSLRHGSYTFFFNRKTLFIQVGSFAFETKGFEESINSLVFLLTTLAGRNCNWLELLHVTRIDLFADFVFEEIFNPDQFKTPAEKRMIIMRGKENKVATYYFGSRQTFMIRLYLKSENLRQGNKVYLKSAWEDKGCEAKNVWRLEFEFRKRKLRRLIDRALANLNWEEMEKLWSYGIHYLVYMAKAAKLRSNLNKEKVHPVWLALQRQLFHEYQIKPSHYHKVNIVHRKKVARSAILSYYAAKQLDFESIPAAIRFELNLTPEHYIKIARRIKQEAPAFPD